MVTVATSFGAGPLKLGSVAACLRDVEHGSCMRACGRARSARIEADHPIHLPNRAIILTNDNSRGEGAMSASADRSAPISLSSEPLSVAVNEHVAARRLGH